MAKLAYFFGDGVADGDASMKSTLGGKGAGLAEMTRIGLPVPPGLTISADVCHHFSAHGGRYPKELADQVDKAIKKAQRVMKAKFGDPDKPLLLSVRSGAAISMPGMMDTVLNLGLNSKTVKGLAKHSNNERFAYDCYRRFVQMYGDVVMGLKPESSSEQDPFEVILDQKKRDRGADTDQDLTVDDLKELVAEFKAEILARTGKRFPENPERQLWGAIGAVFKSWNNPRAVAYRKINRISVDLGTAVNVQAMVYGNIGEDSGTGVAFTRNPSTGEKELYGEYLLNAQGEDVVAGTRTPLPLVELKNEMPACYRQLDQIRKTLEQHYRDMQDLEFTIQQGRLWMLQTRTGKRTGFAAIRIAVDMVSESLITDREALLRIDPEQLNQLLRPIFEGRSKEEALAANRLLGVGLPAGPGAASGKIVFSAEEAVRRNSAGEEVILVRIETSPEDIEGMNASLGILTSRGGMTSHAALVGRQMGKVCVVGCGGLTIDYTKKELSVRRADPATGDASSAETCNAGGDGNGSIGTASAGQSINEAVVEASAFEASASLAATETEAEVTILAGDFAAAESPAVETVEAPVAAEPATDEPAARADTRLVLHEGDEICIDGNTGEVIAGGITTVPSEVLQVVLEGSLEPKQSPTFKRYSKLLSWADKYRKLKVRANSDTGHQCDEAVSLGAEGVGLCRTEHMFFGAGKIEHVQRMILADTTEERREALSQLLPIQRRDFAEIFRSMKSRPVTIRLLDPPLHEFLPHTEEDQRQLAQTLGLSAAKIAAKVEELHEFNPMLGFRGCRLGISFPEITQMQAQAIFEAVCDVRSEGIKAQPEVMIPLVGHVKEFTEQEAIVRTIATMVQKERKIRFPFLVGTMIEIPRAALTAGEIAEHAEFFSFGTNDLTQTALGLSRDDSGRFLPAYIEKEIYPVDPFQSLDRLGVGRLVQEATTLGRAARPDLKIGICGEHGGDPASVHFFHETGLAYVSCSPYRIPIARVAAAQAALLEQAREEAAQTTTKRKPKAKKPAKPKAKARKKAKVQTKSKAKSKAKVQRKSKAKVQRKAKAKVQRKAKAKPKAQRKAKAKRTATKKKAARRAARPKTPAPARRKAKAKAKKKAARSRRR